MHLVTVIPCCVSCMGDCTVVICTSANGIHRGKKTSEDQDVDGNFRLKTSERRNVLAAAIPCLGGRILKL